MSRIRKFYNNLLSPDVGDCLGRAHVWNYRLQALLKAGEIFRARNLAPLDRHMADHAPPEFMFHGRAVRLDCRWIDQNIIEPSYAFGVIREIFIRDCYFRHHRSDILRDGMLVVDLGTNRGIFSAAISPWARQIVCVEHKALYNSSISKNLESNGLTNFKIINRFVGSGGYHSPDSDMIDIQEVLGYLDSTKVDFMKLDIEGAEFSLFSQPDWLGQVGALTMEVHSAHGDPMQIISTLADFGFSTISCDADLHIVGPEGPIEFIYATR